MRARWVVGSALAIGLGCGWGVAQNANPSGSALDQQINSNLQKELSGKKDLKAVQATVQNRTVILSGTVANYRDVIEAEHVARQVHSVEGVINRLQINGPVVSDAELQQQIAQRLVYDRMGQGQTFNAMTVNVQSGVVTVGGEVRDYPDRDSALDIVDDTKGVRGVVDKINVAPLSPMDDQIRLIAAQRIYRNPQLQPYSLNPAKPIRIVVENGHITLAGVVQTPLDKQLAYNAVINIPGVFSVTNDLAVAGEKK